MNAHLHQTLAEVNGNPAVVIEQRLAQLPDEDRRELIRDGILAYAHTRVTRFGWEVIRSCRL